MLFILLSVFISTNFDNILMLFQDESTQKT